MVELGVAVFRLAGLAYLVGGVLAGNRATQPADGSADRVTRGAVALDGARQSWRVTSALMFLAVGAAMLWGRQAAAALLGALLVQQGAYIARQAWTAKSIARSGQAQAHQVSLSTKAAFVATAVFAAAGAILDRFGALQ